jgi:hypothetical protein
MARKTELIQISESVRVESGPRREKAIATAELAPDQDSKGKVKDVLEQTHRTLPNGKRLAKHYKLGMRDAWGKIIQEGEEFTFLDYFGEQVWYMYQLEDVPLESGTLSRMAQPKGLAADQITAEMVAEWFQVPLAWVGVDSGGKPASVKRYMPRGEKPTKDEALIAAARLEA